MKTEVLIVGGGVTGLFTARELLREGFNDVMVVEKDYFGSGGTFRCATGIRASFTSREHVKVMMRAIELWPRWADELGFVYRRDGYLWLLTRERDVEMFRQVVSFHNSLGLNTRLVTPEEAREIVPGLNTSKLLGAVYDPLAGKVELFKSITNLIRELRASGIRLLQDTEVRRLVAKNGRVIAAETNRGDIVFEQLVVAAGTGTRKLLATIGIDLPISNVPKHVLVTETFKPAIKPLIIDWASSSYLVQLIHGNFYIGADIPVEPDVPARNRYAFLSKAARVWSHYFPWLREVYVLRYWTGYYDMTPDHHPIIGRVDEYENMVVAAGFSGHGLMMAPAVAESIVNYLLERPQVIDEVKNMTPSRFREGRLIKEIAVFG